MINNEACHLIFIAKRILLSESLQSVMVACRHSPAVREIMVEKSAWNRIAVHVLILRVVYIYGLSQRGCKLWSVKPSPLLLTPRV